MPSDSPARPQPSAARPAFADGARSTGPLLLGVIPFGLILGVTAAATEIGGLLGYATSPIIFAGAAQLVTIQLVEEGAAVAVIVATALVVNSRHLMYSAVLARPFEAFPTVWRYGLPYVLTDQAFALSVVRYGSHANPVYRRWFFLGAAATLWVTWQITTGTGVLLGATVPEAWSLDFAIPLVFLALLVPVLRDRPSLGAAVVAGTVAVAAAEFPLGLGLITASLSGVAAGVLFKRLAP